MKRASRQQQTKAKPGKAAGTRAQSPAGGDTKSTLFWFLTIFAVAFTLRLVYLFQIATIPLFEHLAGDARTYYEWGRRIAAGDWLGTGVFYQAPLYPYFLGILQFFFGETLWLVRLTQITLGAISCSLIFLIGQQLFSRQAG